MLNVTSIIVCCWWYAVFILTFDRSLFVQNGKYYTCDFYKFGGFFFEALFLAVYNRELETY